MVVIWPLPGICLDHVLHDCVCGLFQAWLNRLVLEVYEQLVLQYLATVFVLAEKGML